ENKVVALLLRISDSAANEQEVPTIILETMEHGDGCPVEETRTFGSLAHREALPVWRSFQKGLDKCCFFASATGCSQELDRLTFGNGQHISQLSCLQKRTQIQIASIDTIGYDPVYRHAGLHQPLYHTSCQFRFGLQANPLRNMSLS